MRLSHNFKAGVKNTPVLIVVIYVFFVVMDLVTTYIASPDLKYEGNKIIRHFNMGWTEIIISAFLVTFLLSYFFIVSLKNARRILKDNTGKHYISGNPVFKNKRMLMYYFLISCFYTHLFCSVFVTISNYLCYIFYHNIKNPFTEISLWYLTVGTKFYPYFFLYIFSIISFFAFLYSAWQITVISRNYNQESLTLTDH